jgi:hypothetical protein
VLIIRKEQMSILREYMLKKFEDRVLKHLNARFPYEYNMLGEERVRETIRDGIERSKDYGVINEYDVRRYLEWMIILGPEFDKDSKTAWAGEILRSKKMEGFEKMNTIDRYATFALREKK